MVNDFLNNDGPDYHPQLHMLIVFLSGRLCTALENFKQALSGCLEPPKASQLMAEGGGGPDTVQVEEDGPTDQFSVAWKVPAFSTLEPENLH